MDTSIAVSQQSAGASIPPLPIAGIEIPSLPKCFKVTTIGLTVTGDATEGQLVKAVDAIEKTGAGVQWQLGDALLEIKGRYPDRSLILMNEALDKIREKHGQASRKQAMQVAIRFPEGTRVPSLSWSHHRACAFFDTLEERLHWIHLARDNNWSVHELEKQIAAASAEPEPDIDPDLYVLKDPAVRAYLETDKERQRRQFHEVPDNAPFLRDLLISRIEAIDWQLNRTVETDCNLVRDAVSETMGTWQQVFYWLKDRSRVVSPPDVRAYLSELASAGRITEQLDEKPNPTAKGSTATVYKPRRNPVDDKRDEEKRSLLAV
ncbi:MAG: hypothetical protein AABN95_15940 [Acidobacteriota bacterium]